MNIVFLMGGTNIDYKDKNYPIYMMEMENEEIVLEKQINHYDIFSDAQFIFCVRSSDVASFNADDVIKQAKNNAICVNVNGKTGGSVCTALLAAEYINSDEELILLSIDELLDVNPANIVNAFRTRQSDAGVVSFMSIHPRYSFARIDDDDDYVSEVAEKKPISKNALASFYYFKRGSDFIECAKNIIRKDSRTNDAFFISQTMNEMILKQKKVALHKIPNHYFHPLKTEMQMAQYMLAVKEMKESN